MLKRLIRSAFATALAGRLIGLYLLLALRTTRWTIDIAPDAIPFVTGQRGAIIAFWHEFLPLVPALWWHAHAASPQLSMSVLISRHRDGRLISGIVRRWDVAVVAGSTGRGSRDKGGATAMRSLLTLLRDGQLIAVTPDGPRGPRRSLQPGIARLAAMSGAPIIAAACATTRSLSLGSWDRMRLPLPFGRGRIVCGAPILIPAQGWRDAMPALTGALDAAAMRAEA